MTVLIKAASIAIAGAVMTLLLKKTAPELSFSLSLAICLLAAGLGAEILEGLEDVLELASEQTGLSSTVVTPVFKCVGIGVVTRLSADMCKDAGQSAAASAVEFCGTACALTAALPLVRSLLQTVGELL